MKTLQQNASTPEGAKALDRALEEHKDDKVYDIFSFLQNVDTNDVAKMLRHIFGINNESVREELARKL